MNKWMVTAMLAAAMVAGMAGTMLLGALQQDTVQAQNGAPPQLKVAIVNIEMAARASRVFKEKEEHWKNAQEDLKRQREKIEADAREVRRNAREAETPERIQELEGMMKALEARMKDAQEKHEAYLSNLMAQYQDEVLQKVKGVVEELATLEGYHIVFQDYSVSATGDEGFFSGSYAQTLLNKPVFFVPGKQLEAKKNAYVADITSLVIDKVK
jgi:Skp family chaperone for outer membrane proteins